MRAILRVVQVILLFFAMASPVLALGGSIGGAPTAALVVLLLGILAAVAAVVLERRFHPRLWVSKRDASAGL